MDNNRSNGKRQKAKGEKKNLVTMDHNNNEVTKMDLMSDWDDELDLNEPLSDGTWGGYRPSPDKKTLIAILRSLNLNTQQQKLNIPRASVAASKKRASQTPSKKRKRVESYEEELIKPPSKRVRLLEDIQQKPYGQITLENNKRLSTASSSVGHMLQSASQTPSKKRKRVESYKDELVKPPSKRVRLLLD